MATDTKTYVPQQKVRRGVAGYRGKDVVIVNTDTGKERSAPAKRTDTMRRRAEAAAVVTGKGKSE